MADTCWIIDRIEGTWAIVEGENGSWLQIPAEQLPAEAEQGDLLVLRDRKDGRRFERDPQATRGREAMLRAQLGKLTDRDPGGDIDL